MAKEIKFTDNHISEIREGWYKERDRIMNLSPKIDIDYDSFRKGIIAFGNIETIKHQREFILDDSKESIVDLLHKYTTKSPEVAQILNKGIALVGGYGTGKTTLLKAYISLINFLIEKNELRNSTYRYFPAFTFCHSFTPTKIENFSRGNIFIDELGREPKSIKVYGTEMNPVLELLFERHRIMGGITHITSNMMLESLSSDDKGYGKMIGDRFKEMFHFVELIGKSLR